MDTSVIVEWIKDAWYRVGIFVVNLFWKGDFLTWKEVDQEVEKEVDLVMAWGDSQREQLMGCLLREEASKQIAKPSKAAFKSVPVKKKDKAVVVMPLQRDKRKASKPKK